MEKQENKVLERAVNERTPLEEREESPYEMYGWEFHKRPLMYALILTILFYAFIFFYINI